MSSKGINEGEIDHFRYLKKKLVRAIKDRRNRDLPAMKFKYLFCEGVYFETCVLRSIEKVSAVVIIGVAENGKKHVIGLQPRDKKSATSWRELFKDLKCRGLDSRTVTMDIVDGLPGLVKVFREEFLEGKVQRRRVQVMRDVMPKVPKKLKQEVADDIRFIFCAKSKSKALQFASQFTRRWWKEIPSAVNCLRTR